MSGFSQRPSFLVVAQSAAAITSPANTSKNALTTVTLPPLGPNDQIHISTQWSFTNSANNKTPAVELGNVAVVGGFVVTTSASAELANDVQNRGATNSQVFSPPGLAADLGTTSVAAGTSAIETNAGAVLTFYATKALGAEVLTLESYQVTVTRG
jgi:hypothetical protein